MKILITGHVQCSVKRFEVSLANYHKVLLISPVLYLRICPTLASASLVNIIA